MIMDSNTSLLAFLGNMDMVHLAILSLFIWLIVEIVFYLMVVFILEPRIQSASNPHPFPSDQKQFILRILDAVDNMSTYSFEKFVSGFFRNAPLNEIYTDNMLSFLAWYMFNKRLEDMTKQERHMLEDCFEESCRRHPALRRIPKGFNPHLKHVSMCLEKVPYLHRPLLMYLALIAFETAINLIFLRAAGFQRLDANGTRYWYRKKRIRPGTVTPATPSPENQPGLGATHCGSGAEGRRAVKPGSNSSSSSRRVSKTAMKATTAFKKGGKARVGTAHNNDPIMFLHGISPGWSIYIHLITALRRDRSVLLIDLDPVRFTSLCFTMPSPQQFADSIKLILHRHSIESVSVVGHSFGSISANWLIMRYPHLVSHLTLIDPVSMLLGFPDVAYSFVYRPPRNFVQWTIYLMASREITVSHMLYRQFWWYQNILWLEDIPDHIGVVVGLATDDQITNPEVLQEYVQRCQEKRMLKAAGVQPAIVSALRYSDSSDALAIAGLTAASATSSSAVVAAAAAADRASAVEDIQATKSKGSPSSSSLRMRGSCSTGDLNAMSAKESSTARTSTSTNSTNSTAGVSTGAAGISNVSLCTSMGASRSASSRRAGGSGAAVPPCRSYTSLASLASLSSQVKTLSQSQPQPQFLQLAKPTVEAVGHRDPHSASTETHSGSHSPELPLSPAKAKLPSISGTSIFGVWEHTSSAINEAVAELGIVPAEVVELDDPASSSASRAYSGQSGSSETSGANPTVGSVNWSSDLLSAMHNMARNRDAGAEHQCGDSGQAQDRSTVNSASASSAVPASSSGVAVDTEAEAAVRQLKKKDKVALIECVVWDEFIHGQILLPGLVQEHFIDKIYRNERSAAIKRKATAIPAPAPAPAPSTTASISTS